MAQNVPSSGPVASPCRISHHGFRRALFVAAAVAFVLAAVDPAAGTIVVEDYFTGGNNTALLGRAPAPTNLPAAAYAGNGNVSTIGGYAGGSPYTADISGNWARVGADAGVALNLGLATPQKYQITITFNISGNIETQANDPHRGAALGFYDTVLNASGGSSHGFNDFTGLVVDRAGSVRLIVDGGNSGIATTIAGFNPALDHTLTYAIDTASGAGTISNIQLDGVSVSLAAPINTFTVARTSYAGFYNSSGGSTETARFDSFSVVVVPEPMPVIGIAGLLVAVCLQVAWRRAKTPQDLPPSAEL